MQNSTLRANSFLVLLASFSFFSIGYSQDILWEKSFGGKHAELLFDAIPTPDYGFILAGSSISGKSGNKTEASQGDLDYWIWKMDDNGEAKWQKSFGGSDMDMLQSVKLTSDGGFILAGTSSSNKGEFKKDDSKGYDDFWIIKLDAKGNELWQKTIGGNSLEKNVSIIQCKDGGYLLGGSSSSNKSELMPNQQVDSYGKKDDCRGGLDYWIIKLKPTGEIVWQKTFGGLYDDELKSIIQTNDEGYLLGGYSNSPESGEKAEKNNGQGDFWILKLDGEGKQQWQRTLGGDKDDNLAVVLQSQDGNYIVGGSSNSGATDSKSKSSKNGSDFWIVKLDSKGSTLWQQTYNFGKYDILTSIVENPDGSMLVGGYAATEKKQTTDSKKQKEDSEGINDYIAMRIDSNGENKWSQTVGSKGDDILKKLLETRDGGYLLAGTSNGSISRDRYSSIGGGDFWVVKLKDKQKPEKPKAPIEAIPNPAQSFTNVIVGFDFNFGTATLYDLSGRQLQKVEIKEKTIPFDLSPYPEGVYIVEVRTNTETNSVKVIKSK
ncbi:T9SS type A sorting domain-containing protein [Flavobacterium sp. SM15]|uniref:T9SS type A sorting domain-containing protein n=1 Tax=Flavobacterium sp. SM15 TaxID=2908005 RepID=UPI001EDAD771|nr:T9SS type A sorting domain-containing protein [Flavobacterium sp. SM15]MCG2611790.1 T9SS type A sorting domain-containing protein [Flavobacterium sp. SM15]